MSVTKSMGGKTLGGLSRLETFRDKEIAWVGLSADAVMMFWRVLLVQFVQSRTVTA